MISNDLKVYQLTLMQWLLKPSNHATLDKLFRQITTIIKVCVAFVFGLQTHKLKDFSEIYQLKDPKPKKKGHTNFYECCDLTKNVYLVAL